LYDSQDTVRAARTRYFEINALGEDGGYGARWVPVKVGPLRLYIYNSPGRKRAVRYHDIHHLLTGNGTSWQGEAEIGAWEVASGCADHLAAWVLNLGAMLVGLLFAPVSVWWHPLCWRLRSLSPCLSGHRYWPPGRSDGCFCSEPTMDHDRLVIDRDTAVTR